MLLSPEDAAHAAYRLEVDVLGGQSGIQDQLSVAMGGINYLEIDAYPVARATALPAWDDLSARLTVLYLGQAHDSSDVHRQVIEDTGAQRSLALSLLREAAIAGRDAVASQDLSAFGQAMIANTDAQRLLHAELVGQDARRIIEVAAAHKATGWKVNGAGGNGGSMTILSATEDDKEAIDGRISAMTDRYRVLPVQVSASGLCVRGTL